ncbi:DUF4411 family protein [Melioribacter sp. Ez-97]|uniref:DUF4411 family protein n=1 Tax=Melioribacter sp. Ez-97 TaxID=3423434 RepID=UPI003EDAE133
MFVFILDTNFFIQSHRVTYPLDVAVTFWQKVKKLCLEQKLISIDKVKNEIFKYDDELKNWIEQNIPDEFFKATETPQVISEYQRVVQWANSKSNHYVQNAINDFLRYENADSWIVAYAISIDENCQIVTQEKSEPNRKNKIKIPEVCHAFNIQYKNIIEMFRELGETF